MLIKNTRYWLEIDAGYRALKANNLAQTEQYYQQAQQVDNNDGYALSGLRDVAAACHNDTAAKRFYQQALQREPANGGAIHGMATLYGRQSPQAALAYINNLPAAQQRPLQETLTALKRDITTQQAEQLTEQGKWPEAAEAYRQVYQPAADDIWLPYHYAQVLRQLNQKAQADDIMQRMANTLPASPERAYAYTLYLSATEYETQALTHLHSLPEAQWNDNMRELAQRLTMDRTLVHI